jgi:K+ transport systems, NAD-binding component
MIRHAAVLVPPGSLLAGTSLRKLRFRQRFNATVLAAKRTGASLQDRLGRLVRERDLLLIQAPLDALRGLQQSSDLVVLDQLDAGLPTTHRKLLAVAVMAAVLLAVVVLVLGDCLDAGSALCAMR